MALAAKRLDARPSLGVWIAAAQLIDLLWPLMLLVGAEQVRITPGITKLVPLEFVDYPITHSLVGCAAWAVALAAVWLLTKGGVRTALLLAGAVLSHWFLDLLTHRPDLPVLPNGPKYGLGLWNMPLVVIPLELAMWAAAIWLYPGRKSRGFWIFVAVLTLIHVGNIVGPPPPSANAIAWAALLLWLIPWWAHKLDRPR